MTSIAGKSKSGSSSTSFMKLCSAFVLMAVCSTLVSADCENRTLTLGWEPWRPYQYMDNDKLTGLDVDLVRAIVEQAGCQIDFKKMPWKRHLVQVEKGKVDLAAGASKTPEREAYAYFTDPYRTESAVMYVRKGEAEKYQLDSLEDLVGSDFKLGVTRGYYYGEAYAEWIKKPEFKQQIDEVSKDSTNYKKLFKERIDGFLADPVSATASLRKEGLLDQVEMLFTVYSDDIFIMVSQASASNDDVTMLNESLATLKQNGTYQKILDNYLK